MDNLQHIDDLLKKSASSFEYAEVGATDWLAVEKKLKHRKKRIYALWFFLALVFVSSSILILDDSATDHNQQVTENTSQPIDNEAVSDPLSTTENPSNSLSIEDADNSNENMIAFPTEVDNSAIRENKLDNNTLSSVKSQNPIITPSIDNVATTSTPSITATSHSELTTDFIKNDQVVASEIITSPPIVLEQADLKQEDQLTKQHDQPLVKDPVISAKKNIKPNSSTGSNQDKVSSKGHWEAGFSFTPSISNKKITENATLAGLIHVNYYNKAASRENSSSSNSAGLNAQYHLPNGMFIATGAFVSERSESTNYDYSIDSVPFIENNNEIIAYRAQTPVPVKHSGSNSYHFIEIPLNIGYKTPISTNFELRSQLGMSYMLLFNQKGKKADYYDLSLKDLSEYSLNKNNIAANVKLGVYWNKKHFTIGAEPIFSYNMTNLNHKESSAIIVKPYSYGFNISTNYKFIK